MVSVQEYIEANNLQSKVEQALNNCVKAKPEDPMSFMVSAACSHVHRQFALYGP